MSDPSNSIDLNRTLALLLSFSLATTALAWFLTDAGLAFALSVLTLSGLKGRLILNDFLGLRAAPSWRRGFAMFLTGFLLIALGLYAVPLIG